MLDIDHDTHDRRSVPQETVLAQGLGGDERRVTDGEVMDVDEDEDMRVKGVQVQHRTHEALLAYTEPNYIIHHGMQIPDIKSLPKPPYRPVPLIKQTYAVADLRYVLKTRNNIFD